MDIKNKKIVFLGDSITQGVGASVLENAYWKRFDSDGAITRGYGIAGTRIARQQKPSNEKWDQYFVTRVDRMDEDADIVVVFGGTNDYGHGDAALGKMSDRSDNTFYGALHNLYTALIKKYPMATIVVMTPLHRLGEIRDYNEMGVRCVGTLKTYVEIIKEVAEYYSFPVLDLYKESGMNPEIPEIKEKYMLDGLHPSDLGHERVYNKLKSFLLNL